MSAISVPMECVETETGRWWLPIDQPSGYVKMIRDGRIQGELIVECVIAHIRPGADVVDIGGGFGQDTVIYAKHLEHISKEGSDAKVHSFDAEPRIFEVLRRNTIEHGCNNVVLYNKAVWHTGGQTLFLANPKKPYDYGGAWVVSSDVLDRRACEAPTQTIETIAIDDLGLDNIGVLKVDTEGADLWALRGSVETIQRCRMPIIFEHNCELAAIYKVDLPAWRKFFESVNYDIKEKLNKHNFLAGPK